MKKSDIVKILTTNQIYPETDIPLWQQMKILNDDFEERIIKPLNEER